MSAPPTQRGSARAEEEEDPKEKVERQYVELTCVVDVVPALKLLSRPVQALTSVAACVLLWLVVR